MGTTLQLVVTEDSARILDETTENSTWFLNVLSVQHRHTGPRFKVSSERQLIIVRLTSPGLKLRDTLNMAAAINATIEKRSKEIFKSKALFNWSKFFLWFSFLRTVTMYNILRYLHSYAKIDSVVPVLQNGISDARRSHRQPPYLLTTPGVWLFPFIYRRSLIKYIFIFFFSQKISFLCFLRPCCGL